MEIPAVKRGAKPRRSKGCNTCIKRKVKCDEKAPQCGQCLKGGRPCSGIATAIFMNTDSATLATTSTFAPRVVQELPENIVHSSDKPRTTSRDDETPRTKGKKRTGLPTPTPKMKELSHSNSAQQDTIIALGFTLPPSISNLEVTNHQLLASFVTFFAKNPSSRVFNNWMSELPRILAASSHAAIKKAIVAAAMVHSAGMVTNKDVLIEGYKWYGAGLSSQRKELEAITLGKRIPTFEELCTPIMLSFCEITCCTSQTAYSQHILGAAALLSKYGPVKCSGGIFLEMFQVIRFQLIYPTIIMRIPSVLGTPDWLTIPFGERPKTILELCINIITVCSELLYKIDNVNNPKAFLSQYESGIEREAISEQTQSLKSELDLMWDVLDDLAQAQGWQGDSFNGVPGFDRPFSREQSHITSPPSTIDGSESRVRDTATHIDISVQYLLGTPKSGFLHAPSFPPGASLSAIGSRPICFYSTARLLVLSILHQLGETPDLYYEQLEAHCGSILNICQHMTQLGIGYAFLRLILPLHVVCMLSPKLEQVKEARSTLEQWKKRGAVSGLCEIALRSTAIYMNKHEAEVESNENV